VKKVFIRSGIRFDYLLQDPKDSFFRELVKYHISGQLKVAPEHISHQVLKLMGKPEHRVYEAFAAKYRKLNDQAGMEQFLVPYFMSSHPGCGLTEAIELAEYLRDSHYNPEQVQDFYPTPSTLSTVMYATGIDPRTGSPVYVCKNPHEKAMQRALMQYRNPKNYKLVKEALTIANRTDLIGYGPKCLIRPTTGKPEKYRPNAKSQTNADRKNPMKSNDKYEMRAKAKHQTRSNANLQIETNAGNHTRSDAKNQTKSDTRNQSRSDTRNHTRSENKNQSRSDAKHQSRSDTRNHTRSDTKNQLRSDVRNQSRSDAKHQSRSDTRNHTRSDNKH
jgi:hypothetical protein